VRRSRIARFASASEKNVRLRRAARIQRSAMRTPVSTFALWLPDVNAGSRTASVRALAIRAHSYRSVESILKAGLDRVPLPSTEPAGPARRHENLRGPTYYE
jgi:hypothetical protein